MKHEILSLARDRICAAHPSLALAMERLRPELAEGMRLPATDGERFFYAAAWAKAAFLGRKDGGGDAGNPPRRGATAAKNTSACPQIHIEGEMASGAAGAKDTSACPQVLRGVEESLLHALAHCLLGHVFLPEAEDAPAWARALACDYQAALLARACAPEWCALSRSGRFHELCRRFGEEMDVRALARAMARDGYVLENRAALEAELALDSHRLWGVARDMDRARTACGGEGAEQIWRRELRALRGGSGALARGREAGGYCERMTLDSAGGQDFARVLRRYAELRENPREDFDSFQPVWYLYGMERLDGAPLIEPMEYREERRIGALAIAIDTSGSCVRGLTRRFLELTRDILFDRALFFPRFKLYILQCDAKLRREDRIVSLAEFQRYIDDLTVIGGGGTDFRPAIARIDQLVATGELRGLKGVLYFSDGRGVFPEKPPDYEVTFVFLKHRFDGIDVPDWVRKVVIDAPAPRGGEYFEY